MVNLGRIGDAHVTEKGPIEKKDMNANPRLRKNRSAKSPCIIREARPGIGANRQRLAAREGAAVAFTYSVAKTKPRRWSALIGKAGGQELRHQKADAANSDEVRGQSDRAVEDFWGRLDILVTMLGGSSRLTRSVSSRWPTSEAAPRTTAAGYCGDAEARGT